MARGRIAVTKPECPEGGEAHGELLQLDGRWHCPHTDHDGRLPNHPRGPAPRTKTFFTDEEVFTQGDFTHG